MDQQLKTLYELASSKYMIQEYKSQYPDQADNEIKYIEWALEYEKQEVIDAFITEYKTKISYDLNK